MGFFAKKSGHSGKENRHSGEYAVFNDTVVPLALSIPAGAATIAIWNSNLDPGYMKLVFNTIALWPPALVGFINTVNSPPEALLRQLKTYGAGALAGVFLVAALNKGVASENPAPPPPPTTIEHVIVNEEAPYPGKN